MKKNSQLLLDIVNSSHAHLTAEDIFMQAKEKSPKIALSTVYNNLAYLVQEGLVRKITIGSGPERYDRATRHDHLVCTKCGRLTDITLADLTGVIERQTGVPIQSYDLNIRYLCEDCRTQT